MDFLLSLQSEVRFSHKFRLLQSAFQASESVSSLFSCVLGQSWTLSSRYDWLLGEEHLAALVLQAICVNLPTTDLIEVVERLCEASEKPQIRELWAIFSLSNPFPSPFLTSGLLGRVAKAWQGRIQLWPEEQPLSVEVLKGCFALLSVPITVESLYPLSFLPSSTLPRQVEGLSVRWVRQAIGAFLQKGEGESAEIAVAMELLDSTLIAEAVEPLAECLSRLPTSPYIPQELAIRALELFNALLLRGNANLTVQLKAFGVPTVHYILLDTLKNPQFRPLHKSLTAEIGAIASEAKDYLKEAAMKATDGPTAVIVAEYWRGNHSQWQDSGLRFRLEGALRGELQANCSYLAVRLLLRGGGNPRVLDPLPGLDPGKVLKVWGIQLQQGCEPSLIVPLLAQIQGAAYLPLYSEVCAWVQSPSLFDLPISTHPAFAAHGLLRALQSAPRLFPALAETVLKLSTWVETDANPLGLLPLLEYALTVPNLQAKLQQERLRTRTFVRLQVLFFLQTRAGTREYSEGMHRLLELALAAMEEAEVLNCNSPYTVQYKRKLYLCQLLIALEPVFPTLSPQLLEQTVSVLTRILQVSMIFDLNVYLQRTLAVVVLQRSGALVPVLLEWLEDLDLKPQFGCCLVLSAGKVLLATGEMGVREQIYASVLPFVISNNAQLRRSAQYVLYQAHTAQLIHCPSDLEAISAALATSKDCVKMRKRLEKSIKRFDLSNSLSQVLTGNDNIFDETYSAEVLSRIESLLMRKSPVPVQTVEIEAGLRKRRVVVVASYLEKGANIAGLVKTCLAFGAQLLAIPNRLILNEADFQTATQGAEQLQPLLEVLPRDVEKFLAYHKAHGYALIGLEQTATSVPIQTYQFPEKSVILLGFEKEGIPPKVIPMLDVCVEIPQYGLIRSLNVHVSAAICLAAYSQSPYLLKQTS